MDQLNFLESNTPKAATTDVVETEQQLQDDDFSGNLTSTEISNQLLDEPSATNENVFNIDTTEDSENVTNNTTETDQFNSEQTELFSSTNEDKGNIEQTIDTSDDWIKEAPRTSEEIFSSSSPFVEDTPKLDERTARVQAINRRIEEELAARDEGEARRKADLLQQAKQDLDRWYQERERQMNEKRQQMKKEEDTLRTFSLEKSDKNACDWAKVIRLLEFGPGSQLSKSKRDLSRMKASIINAKRQAEINKSSNNV